MNSEWWQLLSYILKCNICPTSCIEISLWSHGVKLSSSYTTVFELAHWQGLLGSKISDLSCYLLGHLSKKHWLCVKMGYLHYFYVFYHYYQFWKANIWHHLGQKQMQIGAVEDICFWKDPLEFLDLSLYPWKLSWLFLTNSSCSV